MLRQAVLETVSARTLYGKISFYAAFVAFGLMTVMMVSVGDTHRTLKIPLWFSWHIPLLVIIVCDQNPHGYTNNRVAEHWQTLIRLAGSTGALIQCAGFLIWAVIEWTQHADVAQIYFFAAASATLGMLAVLYTAITVALLRSGQIV